MTIEKRKARIKELKNKYFKLRAKVPFTPPGSRGILKMWLKHCEQGINLHNKKLQKAQS